MTVPTTVFGPVRSRRLGWSLGVDPLPAGMCSYDCVYCQLGRTRACSLGARLGLEPARVLEEVARALARIGPGVLDWITLVGAGEPTLYAGLAELICGLKAMDAAPVAVITNGSLLHRAEVRAALAPADAVLPSLDTADEHLFRAINRPHPDLDLVTVIEGLTAFRHGYRGILQVEVMLVDGLNDSDSALEALAAALGRIQPDAVQVGVPSRPPSELWVRPPPAERVARAVAMLGGDAPPLPSRSAAAGPPRGAQPELPEALAAIIQRHPMTVDELAKVIAVDSAAVATALAALEQRGEVQRVARFRREFWTTSRARYGREEA